jgi:hypothetical protein
MRRKSPRKVAKRRRQSRLKMRARKVNQMKRLNLLLLKKENGRAKERI